MNAVKLRLRPIIMTSLAFILGMVPLVISTGAGAASRIAVGTGVMGGMIAATLLGIFFIPLFYMSVRRWISGKRPPGDQEYDQEPSRCAAALAPELPARSQPPHVRPEFADDRAPIPPTTRATGAQGAHAADDRLARLLRGCAARGAHRHGAERNRDLAVAVAQIEEARGLYRIHERTDCLPTLDARRRDARSRQAPPVLAAREASPYDRYSRRSRRRAVVRARLLGPRAQPVRSGPSRSYLGTVEAARAFRLSLIREVALAYLALARGGRAHRSGRGDGGEPRKGCESPSDDSMRA